MKIAGELIMKPKHPTMKEKIAVYERLLHDLHFHSTVTMRQDLMMKMLGRISAWSFSHRGCNGELNEKEAQEHIDAHFWDLEKPL